MKSLELAKEHNNRKWRTILNKLRDITHFLIWEIIRSVKGLLLPTKISRKDLRLKYYFLLLKKIIAILYMHKTISTTLDIYKEVVIIKMN